MKISLDLGLIIFKLLLVELFEFNKKINQLLTLTFLFINNFIDFPYLDFTLKKRLLIEIMTEVSMWLSEKEVSEVLKVDEQTLEVLRERAI